MEGTLKKPLQIKQGDTFILTMTWTDSAGSPVDLTNCTAKMQLRTAAGGTMLLELSTDNNRITLDAGSIELEVDANTMSTFTTPKGVWDLQITYPDGLVTTILTGTFVTIPDITV